MRIAGIRVAPSYARLLAQIVADAGYGDTATTLTEAIRLEVVEPPLTLDDHDAIRLALASHCPSGLDRLRRELVEDDLRRRSLGL